ncbi:LysR substrate-binding domain-containing protein [Cognatishimia sp. 1_MG-2023]|uniref:LysR substrate-binding domain-containing protein n=1 Tax=Cognatishimia sp. 1_MG-2023 TaxID=3062642 RepID=UPI0026E28FDA|nr:LysR substrate-binding domain-containing protein [Cognatishimia sp. 1_MG-2023]MDO6726976.1 LysR substrate-binding domain-containing protein [Cognatishimia sp. 1_MG-2023]
MQISRRSLPPLGWLTAFEAVARTGSVTAAAQQLDLTQGAVSRQLQKLEDFLDYKLFLREKKRLTLTPVGAAYAESIREGLTQISNATVDLRSNPHGGVLNLAILPAFGAHWLAPRLADFLSGSPGVTVNLSTRLEPFDFSRERFHAAIHFGRDNWAGTETMHLLDEELVPVMSEHLAKGRQVQPAMLRDMPLLHLESRPNAWRRWFAQNDVPVEFKAGMVFDQFATMLQAAAGGLGVALMPRFLLEGELQRNQLIALDNAKRVTSGAYYLVWPETKANYPPLQALRKWMEQQV